MIVIDPNTMEYMFSYYRKIYVNLEINTRSLNNKFVPHSLSKRPENCSLPARHKNNEENSHQRISVQYCVVRISVEEIEDK